jgi:hypothetical protein
MGDKNMKRFGIISIFLLLLTSCQEEMFPENKFEAGLPAALSLDLTVPTANDIAVTKAINDYESEIREFALILANGNSIQNVVDLTGNLQSQSTTTQGGRTYKLANPVTEGLKGAILSGTYTIYGIANWSSPFCNLTLEAIQNFKSVNDLKAALSTNPDLALTVSGSQLFPMSGVNESVNILPIEASAGNTETAPNGNSISISLKRIISRIEFVFKNGNNEESPKFVPTSYSIYNLPKGAKLISSEDNQVNTEYGHQENLEIPGSEIRFFMLENVKPAGSNTSYADRDKWTGPSGASPTEKQFTNAPEGSTFVVVKGEYSGKSYFGHVSYTIHLGNFSGKSTDKSPAGNNNFTINRNEYHKYTVTVKGVNNIAAEAEVETPNNGGDVPAAEGTLTEISNKLQFVLDAHYETVMLSFDLNGLCENPSMIINTPFTNGAEKYSFTDDISNADYKWIHFMAPTSASVLPKYDNTKTCTVDQLAAELKAAWNNGNKLTTAPSGSHYIISGGKVYTTAFIDEYYYEGKDWTTFVNTDNRILILNPDEEVSPDGNSVLYPDYIFSIAQRSIKTTYNLDPTINAFGIETWNETGRLAFATNSLTYNQKNDYDVTLTEDNGWANSRALWLDSQTITGNGWEKGKWVSTNTFGYTASVADNLKESHVYSGATVDYLNAFNACLTRNRDEDGDGNIDEDEIKWYLPALEQYTSMWLADDYLTEDTRLFDPLTQSYNGNDIMFYTSSQFNRRLYYAAEGASYGKVEDASWASDQQSIRCVRSLKETKAAPTPTSENDKDNRIITVSYASDKTLRMQTMTGEYTKGHYERSLDNRLPIAFQVATYILGENIPIDSDDPEVTWLTAVSNGASITRTGSGSNYTYTITITFNSQSGITYSVDGTALNPGSNGRCSYSFTVTGGRSLSSTTKAIAIKATKDGVTNTVTANVTYSWTSSYFGSGSGSASVSYANTITGGSSASIKTGRGDGVMDKYSLAQLKTSTTLCATNYYEQADGSDLGQWRVPNQRELMLMAQWDYFPEALHPDLDSVSAANAVYFTSSTFYTNDNGNNNFTYIKNGFTREGSSTMYIRCVRDADHISTNPDDGEDGDDEGGNTGTGGGSGDDLTR